ncbi:hypothetical protein P7F88_17335 [Vibrio hannami]|uniref:hypothetical protein n=1 Tax=Vibrio hannami TaxID=2717094 RepID=UPI00240F9038|nr:hypothetical protein [Vibrio hannami]MDG3087732.1 hypothetical protein [Vibrio hannami]
MNHLIEKPWEYTDDNETTKHIVEKHRLRANVGFVHSLVRMNDAAHRSYDVLKERGMDMLLFVVPCVLVLPLL